MVATSHNSHAEIVIAALESGAHVLVEKPMALTSADAWAMVDAAVKHDRILMVGFNDRMKPQWQAAKRELDGGAIGTVRQVAAAWGTGARWFWETERAPEAFRQFHADGKPIGDVISDGYWRSDPEQMGGGMFVDLCSHAVDIMLWLGGAPAERVMAFREDAGVHGDDSGFFGDGHMSLFGDAGVLSAEWSGFNLLGANVQISAHGTRNLEPSDEGTAPAPAFVAAVLDGAPNLCPGEQGARAVEFAEAVYRSAAEAQPVTIQRRSSREAEEKQ